MNWQQHKSYATVLGHRMAYVEAGKGAPIVLLHGNPTSSYIWRTVIPALEGMGRVIAPDLIGMGDSDKLGPEDPTRYTFLRHRNFVDALLDELGVTENVTLVLHDWGSALGFDWARRHPTAVRAIAYMEAIVTTLKSWDDWEESSRALFQAFRSEQGEKLILQDNAFIEMVLPAGTLRPLDTEEMDEYRRPFMEPGEGRLPTLTWPRQIPAEGEPAEVVRIVEEYAAWLAKAPGIPKLFVNAEPGVVLRDRQRAACRKWPDQTEITVSGAHFVQEDSGTEIGTALASWLTTLP
ncbi:haloalkane dehalogenase [Streptomyces sp. KS_5]|uniref:haloalkane dehalogenase n=1 Tax=Streptomyces sp. KS_5 TaxID=1881018 RepID=UPI00089C2D94|nr:haloalkane dehalogenase [Streptomyces sp. KS_5]SEE35163.1 haloalkane dehalogenase [Streptomyces sp. KS_5]